MFFLIVGLVDFDVVCYFNEVDKCFVFGFFFDLVVDLFDVFFGKYYGFVDWCVIGLVVLIGWVFV